MPRPTNDTLTHEAELREHGVKTCRSCRQVFPLSDFGRLARSRDGLQANCKVCVNARNRKYEEVRTPEQVARRKEYNKRLKQTDKHKRKDKATYVRRSYNMTLEEYEYILSLGCAICGDKAEHMDHSHVTGKVRSGLCSSCNLGLGKFKDDPELLIRAAYYVGLLA